MFEQLNIVLYNYFKIAVRNFKKQGFYALINLGGLTFSISLSLLLLLYIYDELNYDRFHQRADNTYRIIAEANIAHSDLKMPVVPIPTAATLLRDFEEVEAATGFQLVENVPLATEEKTVVVDKIYAVDNQFSNVFDIGSAVNLADLKVNEIVLSADLAQSLYFGAKAIGEQVTYGEQVLTVAAVLGPMPGNSHLRFDALVSAKILDTDPHSAWSNFQAYTYITLKDGMAPGDFDPRLEELVDTYLMPVFEQFNAYCRFELQPLKDIHLHSQLRRELSENGNAAFIYALLIVALMMLILGSLNYVNLATATSLKRSKEIGVRKVLGSEKPAVRFQFFLESLVITVASCVLGLIIVDLLLPYFNAFTGKLISIKQYSIQAIALAVGIVLIVALAAGIFPALQAARFKLIEILKGRLHVTIADSTALRKVLVVFQITLTLAMMITTAVVYSQLQFLHEQPLGYNADNLLVIDVQSIGSDDKFEELKALLQVHPNTVSVASASITPFHDAGGLATFQANKSGQTEEVLCSFFSADSSFLQTLGIEVIQQEQAFNYDSSVYVNLDFVQELSLSDIKDTKLHYDFNNALQPTATNIVVGITNDFNFSNLKNQQRPTVIFPSERNDYIYLRFNGSQQSVVAELYEIWKQLGLQGAPSIQSVSDGVALQYTYEHRFLRILQLFTFAISVVTIIGLFGLATYITESRKKEISLRKISGAGNWSILKLLVGEYLAIFMLSAVIAWFLGFYVSMNWLQNFAYRIELGPALFAITTTFVAVMTLLAASYHISKALATKPAWVLNGQ